jgi:hypothetical protein
MIKNIHKKSIAFIILILMIRITACTETPIEQIVTFSGTWKISFNNASGQYIGESTVTIEDDGSFCSIVQLSSGVSNVFVKGKVAFTGSITGGFTGACSQNAVGNFSGEFDELLGAGFASGVFSDTATGSGKWYAV